MQAMTVQPAAVLRRIGANLARGARRLTARFVLPRRGGVWLMLRLGAPIDELAAPTLPFGERPLLGLLDILAVLEAAGRDARVAGVVLRFEGPVGGPSRALSLRRAVDRVRAAGKPVVVWSESFDAESLVAASGGTRLYLPESGNVFLVGLRLESLHWKRLLDRLGVQPEIVRVGRHKSAAERFTRDRLSPEDREQLEELADDLYESLIGAVAEGRGLGPAALRDLVDTGPHTAAAAVGAGLAAGGRYPDEVGSEFSELAPSTALDSNGRPRVVDAATYCALCVGDPGWRPLGRDLPRVAYVVARGGIHRGAGTRGIAVDRLRVLLERLRADERVCGVLLRIDSPGGDAVASDLLWRAVTLVAREKPVVVSMGDVVASGGYYVAAAADAVFAERATVTGSIGVVGGRANLEGLYEKIGLTRDGVERGARAGLLSHTHATRPDERAALRELFESVHATFSDRVARGRGLDPERVAELATGRVWSGGRAVGLGLVDTLGGPLEALGELRRRAGLAEGERYILDLHPRIAPLPGLFGFLRRATGRAAW
jgi:protease-4